MAAGRCPAEETRLERAVLARLRLLSREELALLPGLSEGIENRLADAVRQAGSLEELVAAVKTKRYPLTRVKRLVWSAFLGVQAGWEKRRPPYIRVLGPIPGVGDPVRCPKGPGRNRGSVPSSTGVPRLSFRGSAGGGTAPVCAGMPGIGPVRPVSAPSPALRDGMHRRHDQGVGADFDDSWICLYGHAGPAVRAGVGKGVRRTIGEII